MAILEGLQSTLKEWNNKEISEIKGEQLSIGEVELHVQHAQEQFANHELIRDVREQVEPNNEKLEQLGKDYERDLKEISPYPDTIGEISITEWQKIDPEQVKSARQEFNNSRDEIIAEWEKTHGQEWPRYEEDIYSNNGVLIREKGDLYDAHHLQPLEYDGKNIVDNITPLHAKDHYDRQGIHSMTSVYQEIKVALG